jgi:uncharacterized UPF0160 family protein
MSIEAMKQALEALETIADEVFSPYDNKLGEAIIALRTAIAEAEKQEPFGYFQYSMHMDAWVQNRDSNKGVAFYTTPQPQREWVGLTDEEIRQIALDTPIKGGNFAHAIEQRLKEKNT